MSLENQRNWLRLALLPGMQFGEFYRLLKTFGLPEEIFFTKLIFFNDCYSTNASY